MAAGSGTGGVVRGREWDVRNAETVIDDRPEGQKRSTSRKAERKREEIVQAAIQIINAKSFAGATMSDIAAALDLRDAALYYYFPSKQDLVYACHRQSLQRFEDILGLVDAGEASGGAKLKRFLHDLVVDALRSGPQIYFGDHSYLDEARRDGIDAWGDRLKATLQRFIEEGMADGSIAPCEAKLVVQLMLGMLIWIPKWIGTVDGMTGTRLLAAIEGFCFTGLQIR